MTSTDRNELIAAAHRAAQIAECADLDVQFALINGDHWSQVDKASQWAAVARRASDHAFAALEAES